MGMSTAIDARSDLEAVRRALAAGQRVSPEISRCVEERADEIRRRLGTWDTEYSVLLVREAREE